MNFSGSYVAIVTPFNPDGSVNFDKLKELVQWHLQEGTDGIVEQSQCASHENGTEKLDILIIRNYGFSVEIPYSSDKICAFVLSDKKRNGSTVNFIIPEYIGKCSIVPVSVESIPYIIQAGL